MTNAEPSEARGASRFPVDDDVIARALLRWAQATYPGRKFTVVCEPDPTGGNTVPIAAAHGSGGES